MTNTILNISSLADLNLDILAADGLPAGSAGDPTIARSISRIRST